MIKFEYIYFIFFVTSKISVLSIIAICALSNRYDYITILLWRSVSEDWINLH